MLRENKTTKWADALPFVQAAKNQRYHSGIKRSPYEAVFGKKWPKNEENSMQTSQEEVESANEPEDYDDMDDNGCAFKKIDGSFIFDDRVIMLENQSEENYTSFVDKENSCINFDEVIIILGVLFREKY